MITLHALQALAQAHLERLSLKRALAEPAVPGLRSAAASATKHIAAIVASVDNLQPLFMAIWLRSGLRSDRFRGRI